MVQQSFVVKCKFLRANRGGYVPFPPPSPEKEGNDAVIGCSASLVFSLLHACLGLLRSTPLQINKGANACKLKSLDTVCRFIR